jgi:hypothetical protein
MIKLPPPKFVFSMTLVDTPVLGEICMTKRKKQDKKADKSKDVAQKLNEIIVKKEKNKSKHVFRVKELIEALPKDTKINYRKDGYVKLYEGNVYLRNITYGVQMLENKILKHKPTSIMH